MEIQQNDGVVVEVAGSRQGFAKLSERERCHGREREAPGAVVRPPSLPPPIYRPPGGAPALGDLISKGGGGQVVASPPSQVGGAPTPRVSNPRRMGRPKGGRTSPPGAGSPPTSAHGALRDRWPHPVDPRDPSVVPVQYR